MAASPWNYYRGAAAVMAADLAGQPDSGLMVGWRDARASRPGYRVRWLRNDATPDPVAPDTGRVALDDRDGGSSWEALGLLGDGAGGFTSAAKNVRWIEWPIS